MWLLNISIHTYIEKMYSKTNLRFNLILSVLLKYLIFFVVVKIGSKLFKWEGVRMCMYLLQIVQQCKLSLANQTFF